MARTHYSINVFFLALIAAASIAVATACKNTAEGLKKDTADIEAESRDERAQAKEAAKDVANDAAQAARTVGRMAADAGEEVAERASALKENVDIKSALMADPAVDATRIDVDVDYRTRTVTLNGYVPTQGERDRAAALAKEKAPGYKVVNNIGVQPRG